MRGKRLGERDLVMAFVLAQSEDDSGAAVGESELETVAAAVATGNRALASALQSMPPLSLMLAPSAATSGSGLSELSLSEWLEALLRVATLKWDDPTMAVHEKFARVVDAIAVRLLTDPTSGWRPGGVGDVVKAATVATRRGVLGGGGM